MLRQGQFGTVHFIGIGIVHDFSITELNNPGCIFFRKLRIMGNHNDEAVLCYFFQKIHDLNARFRIQCTGWLVSKKDIGVVDQRPCDGYPLHLATGHLVWPLVELIFKPNLLQSSFSPPLPLSFGNSGNG